MSENNLFVIGRNIYQAACGGANAANQFIDDFMDTTNSFDRKKQKAILDGMLFEVFFDSHGKLRETIKGRCFDEVFALQLHAQLKSSFDFIANVLTATHGTFYAIPGTDHELAVTVATKETKEHLCVEAIYVNGANVLRANEDEWDVANSEHMYTTMTPDELNKQLSEELVVPSQSLKITYTPASAAKAYRIEFPIGWTVRRT